MSRLRRPAGRAVRGRRRLSFAEPLEARRLLAANLNFAPPMQGRPALDYVVDGVPGADAPAPTWSSQLNVSALGVQNLGDADVPAGVLVNFYLSADAIITADDVLLGVARSRRVLRPSDGFISPSPSAQTFQTTTTLSGVRPAGFAASGTFYLGAVVDPTNRVAESSETDNVTKFYVRPIAFSDASAQPARANLVFAAPPTASATLNPLQPFTFSYTVRNAGTATSGPAAVDAYLSADGLFDELDERVPSTNATNAFTFGVPALQPGQSVVRTWTGTFAQLTPAFAAPPPLAAFAPGQTVRLGAILRNQSVGELPAESNTADNTTRFYVRDVTLAQPVALADDSNDQLVEARYAGSLASLGAAPFAQGNYVIDGRADVDVYAFDVTAAGQRVDVRAAYTGLGLAVSVLDRAGRPVATVRNGVIDGISTGVSSKEAHVGYTFAAPGRYYAAVSANRNRAGGFPYGGSAAFDARYGFGAGPQDTYYPASDYVSGYGITIRAVPDRDADGTSNVNDANDTRAEAFDLGALGSGGLSVPSADLLDDLDVDVYRFTAPAGAQVRVRSDLLSGTVSVGTATVSLGGRSNYFNSIFPNDQTAVPADFTFTVPAGGVPLYISVLDVDNSPSSDGNYDDADIPGFSGDPDGQRYYDVRVTLV